MESVTFEFLVGRRKLIRSRWGPLDVIDRRGVSISVHPDEAMDGEDGN